MSSIKSENLLLEGVSTHNLKNISVSFPINKISAIIGPSGSGKSSLLFHTIYAESLGRYTESLSGFARQFLQLLPRPPVSKFENLQPAIGIKQSISVKNKKSTLLTLSEISDLLPFVFEHFSQVVCPTCDKIVVPKNQNTLSADISTDFLEQKIMILCSLDLLNKMDPKHLRELLLEQGFFRLLEKKSLEIIELQNLDLKKIKNYYLLIDRIKVKDDSFPRIYETLSLALKFGKGSFLLLDEKNKIHTYSQELSCMTCKSIFEKPKRNFFSLSHSLGLCQNCRGFGYNYELDWEKIKSSEKFKQPGALAFFKTLEKKKHKPYYMMQLIRFSKNVDCPVCERTGLNPANDIYKIDGNCLKDVTRMSVATFEDWTNELSSLKNQKDDFPIFKEILNRIHYLKKIGLSYLTLNRQSVTLSKGELQRVFMAKCLGNALTETLYCLDEPSKGLHPHDIQKLKDVILDLKTQGNTILMVEHDRNLIESCDYVVEIGPKSGKFGGEVVSSGKQKTSKKEIKNLSKQDNKTFKKYLTFQKLSKHNLKNIAVKIPLEKLTCICGVSGGGKSTLMSEIFALSQKDDFSFDKTQVFYLNQNPIQKSRRSNIATYLGFYEEIRNIFAKQPASQAFKLTATHFSFNTPKGRCESCEGMGFIVEDYAFLGEQKVTCPECLGKRFTEKILSIQFLGKNLLDILALTVEEAYYFFHEYKKITNVLETVLKLGLGYITLGQSLDSFSGGEAQRLKLLSIMTDKAVAKNPCLLFLDEPTSGLSDNDVEVLFSFLEELTDKGHTLITTEHHLDFIRSAHWVIELGPVAGNLGGYKLFEGIVSDLKKDKKSVTGKYL